MSLQKEVYSLQIKNYTQTYIGDDGIKIRFDPDGFIAIVRHEYKLQQIAVNEYNAMIYSLKDRTG